MRSVFIQSRFNQPGLRRSLSACAAAALLVFLATPAAFAETQRRDATAKSEPQASAERAPLPRTILISLRKQRLRLLDGNREIASSRISSGQPGFDTPTGVFSILEKNVYHESNIYAGAPMPFMQRITWSGIAMHAGVVPGYRASHGCIRLPYSFAKTFYDKTNVGGRVVITQDEVVPVAFEHEALFRPLPANDPVPVQGAGTEARVAVNDKGPGTDAIANLMAVTPAMADETVTPPPSGKPRSRAEAVRMLAEKTRRLQDEMKTAEAAKVASSEKAKATLRAADDAEARLKSVRQPFEGVLKAAGAADAARAAAADAYRKFLRSAGTPADTSARARIEDKELELEDRLLDLTVEADAARANAAQAELAIADAKSAFTLADANKQKAIDEVKSAVTSLRSAQTALIEIQKEQQRRARQLAIFISLKSQKLYIRQGFEPVQEMPISVDDPPGAIGTHVFTAMDYDASGNNFVWQLISAQQPRLAAGQSDDSSGKKKKNKDNAVAVGATSPINIEAARVALDAIRIPQDTRDTIAELARPGMSLIISEKDLSGETGKGTEFVVLTR